MSTNVVYGRKGLRHSFQGYCFESDIDISVALDGTSTSLDDRITKRGLLPLTLSDGSIYYQTCFYCANMVETIYHPLPSLYQATNSTIGTKKAARILLLLAASGSQAKTASCLCFSIWNTARDYTIVHLTSSPSIRTLRFGLTVIVLLPRL